MPVEQSQWSDVQVIFALCLSVFGVLSTIGIVVIFRLHHDTAIVKASSRELTYLILFGLIGAYVSTLPLVAPPTSVTCAFGVLVPAVSFALIYSSLATKTNRIARILAVSQKKTHRVQGLRFLTWSAQVSRLIM